MITAPTLTTTLTLEQRVARHHAWLETMHGPDGYGGPVVHWWQNSLQFTGAGLDWRYEGIILGYLNLYHKTGSAFWLNQAKRAGNDLVNGQLPGGNFRESQFQLNPYSGGTPHEATCDLALLSLAKTLKNSSDPDYEIYVSAARRNIEAYYIARLWNQTQRCFYDNLEQTSFVPNKAASLTEALFLLSEISGDERYADQYALPTLQAVIAIQMNEPGRLHGALHQYRASGHPVNWFFPYYAARTIPGLIAGYHRSQDERLLDAARAALGFIWRWRHENGSFPQVIYSPTQVNRYPVWIAGAGDFLLAHLALQPYGIEADAQLTLDWILAGQMSSGAFRTAHGFGSQITQSQPDPLPEFRDLLPVCGWSDKTFRYLTAILPEGTWVSQQEVSVAPVEMDCVLREKRATYYEDTNVIELRGQRRVSPEILYRWVKGERWAAISCLDLLWK